MWCANDGMDLNIKKVNGHNEGAHPWVLHVHPRWWAPAIRRPATTARREHCVWPAVEHAHRYMVRAKPWPRTWSGLPTCHWSSPSWPLASLHGIRRPPRTQKIRFFVKICSLRASQQNAHWMEINRTTVNFKHETGNE